MYFLSECPFRTKFFDRALIEARIARVKQQIETKKKAKFAAQQKEVCYNQTIQHHQLLQKILANALEEHDHHLPIETRPSLTGKHDLTQLLATTPDLVFKKIELLIQQRIDSDQPFNSQELEHIHQLIVRLPRDQVEQFVSNALQQLKNEVQTIQKLDREKQPYVFQQHIEDQQNVIEYHSTQKQRAEQLTKKKDQLELQTREAEVRLVRRVRELYADRAVQSALV